MSDDPIEPDAPVTGEPATIGGEHARTFVLDGELRVLAAIGKAPGAVPGDGGDGGSRADRRSLPARLRDHWSVEAARAVEDLLRWVLATGEAVHAAPVSIRSAEEEDPATVVWTATRIDAPGDASSRPALLCRVAGLGGPCDLEVALRRSEEALRRRTDLFDTLFDRIPVMLVLWDPDVERLRLNARAESTLGWTTEEANCGDFMARIYPDHAYRAEVIGYMQSLAPGWREFRCTTRDGTVIPTEWANVRLADDTVIGIGVDLRERRAAEAALRSARDELEGRVAERTDTLQRQRQQLRRLARELASAEHRERKRLAAVLHDDLQQHLVALRMRLALARQRSRPNRFAATVDEAIELVDGAIASSRSLTYELRPPVLYEDGLVPAIRWLAGEMAQRHGLCVQVEATPLRTRLDEDLRAMLFQAVRELLFNVVKHAGSREATVTVGLAERRLTLRVEDAGHGFPKESAEPKPRSEGGLGLFSLRERLESIGGTMDLRSTPGRGTSVTLELPVPAETDRAATGEGWESAGPAGTPRPEAGSHAVPSVLVVDDHAVVRQGLVTLIADDERLRVAGEAGDGGEALAVVERIDPDLVLMDVNMPRMNGIEATRRIRRRWPDVRVVGLSVQDDPAMRRSMLEAGASAFVSKADDAETLVQAMLGALAGT